MDTTTAIYKLPIHEHHLFPSARIKFATCGGCHVREFIYNGYYCNESNCRVRFHKECAEAPLEINHHSHHQHPLQLTNDSGDGPCDLCGAKLLPPCYSCSTCEFKVDLTCGMKPSPLAIEHPTCHDHPLVFLKKRAEENPCELCKVSIDGASYSCLECDVYFHVDCVHLSNVVNHPHHSSHHLELIASKLPYSFDAKKDCLFCHEEPDLIYHCSTCNFSTCIGCTKNPPPLVIEHSKTHMHPLTRLSKKMDFTCDACGKRGDDGPYVCVQCAFLVHTKCIDLPRVININRHDHRITYTPHLGRKYLECGVCRKILDEYYGAYTCLVSMNCIYFLKFVVHPLCAVRNDVWDGKELEGTVDDDTEDTEPYKSVGDELIIHFSHEKHILRLHRENLTDDWYTRCEACIQPIAYHSFYSCEECHFVLHSGCANFCMKKRLVFTTTIFTLEGESDGDREVLDCELCGILSVGFKYTSGPLDVDVLCATLYEPFHHDGHQHPMYFVNKECPKCDGCDNKVDGYVFRCDDCNLDLCLRCANLPEKLMHRNDEHPMILCRGDQKAKGIHWCDICETKLDPSKWFYTCSGRCGVTLHANCVVGDFSRLMPGRVIEYSGYPFEVVLNDHNTRPTCSVCLSRCKFSVILKDLEDDEFICSRLCFSKIFTPNTNM